MSVIHPMNAGAILTIDLGAICDNWHLLNTRAGDARCAAVVKADGYGLGAKEVANALYLTGCRHFFVAHLTEGMSLRPTLPGDANIYILHGIHPGAEREALQHKLIPILNSPPQIAAWKKLAENLDLRLPAALQIDTGMARMGLTPDEIRRFAQDPAQLAGIELRFIMSHLAAAEDQQSPISANQLQRFKAALDILPQAEACFANSSGIFLGADYHFNMVRPGAALYGVAPVMGAPNPMKQVIRLQGKIAQLRTIEAGTPVGYSHRWTAAKRSRIATVAIGYADGYLRSLGNHGQARYQGIDTPIVGNVSMDTITLDVSAVPENDIYEGALIDIADGFNGVDAIARQAGTIGYEILTSLGHRYARRYLNTPD